MQTCVCCSFLREEGAKWVVVGQHHGVLPSQADLVYLGDDGPYEIVRTIWKLGKEPDPVSCDVHLQKYKPRSIANGLFLLVEKWRREAFDSPRTQQLILNQLANELEEHLRR